MHNQHGGIISKVLLIPIGFAFAAGFFFLGYYVGRYQTGQTSSTEKPPALPELVSQYLPGKEEFTFYKTLTEKGDKTVSIDLKPKAKSEEGAPPKKEANPGADAGKSGKQPDPERSIELKTEKAASQPEKQAAPNQQPQKKKDTASAKTSNSKLRYTIQVGSYPEKALAEEEVKSMKRRGYAAFLVATELSDKGKWYRVRVGSFLNKAAAEKLANELRAKEGLTPFITVE